MRKYKASPINASRADQLREGPFMDPRYNTNKLMELVEMGVVSAKSLVYDLLLYLSDDEVGEFMKRTEYDVFVDE